MKVVTQTVRAQRLGVLKIVFQGLARILRVDSSIALVLGSSIIPRSWLECQEAAAGFTVGLCGIEQCVCE